METSLYFVLKTTETVLEHIVVLQTMGLELHLTAPLMWMLIVSNLQYYVRMWFMGQYFVQYRIAVAHVLYYVNTVLGFTPATCIAVLFHIL